VANKSIRTDYLAGSPELKDFYQYSVVEPDFAQIIADKSRENVDRQSLQEVIREQYQGLPMSEASRNHLERLADPKTFTITTGHQLVLFGGPLFTTYKVLTAIKLAAQLSEQFPEHHFVPIFWIHTEDHDYEEVNHYFPSFREKQTYEAPFRTQVGSHMLTDAIEAVKPTHLDQALLAAYQEGRSMTDAFRRFINQHFGEYGVLMLDSADARLKAHFKNVLDAEIKGAASFEAVTDTSRKLAAAGYPLQIAPREINLFYLDQQGRNRIVAVNGHFEAKDRALKWSPDELAQLMTKHPENFSPNVSLRPLYQEMILPNLCYIGGWGELSYWLQLRGVFERFGVNFPLLLPRMSGTLIPQSVLTQWEELGFAAEDFRLPIHDLYRKFTPQVWDSGNFLDQSTEILTQIAKLTQLIENELSPTLARSGKALQVKTQRYLQNLEKKAHRVVRHRHPEGFRKLENLKLQVQPDGMVQERVLSLLSFPGHRPEELIRLAWEHCQPLSLEHEYLVLPD
jgi:bacillithiol biosynthesis cysteine-adding enzyme BshC